MGEVWPMSIKMCCLQVNGREGEDFGEHCGEKWLCHFCLDELSLLTEGGRFKESVTGCRHYHYSTTITVKVIQRSRATAFWPGGGHWGSSPGPHAGYTSATLLSSALANVLSARATGFDSILLRKIYIPSPKLLFFKWIMRNNWKQSIPIRIIPLYLLEHLSFTEL